MQLLLYDNDSKNYAAVFNKLAATRTAAALSYWLFVRDFQNDPEFLKVYILTPVLHLIIIYVLALSALRLVDHLCPR